VLMAPMGLAAAFRTHDEHTTHVLLLMAVVMLLVARLSYLGRLVKTMQENGE